METLWKLEFKFGLAIKRIHCLIYGCDESYESGWNMPDDWYSPTWCKRCDACHDVYNIESSPWPLIYNGDRLKWRIQAWLQTFTW